MSRRDLLSSIALIWSAFVRGAIVAAAVLFAACGRAPPRETGGGEPGTEVPATMTVVEFADALRSAVGEDRPSVRDRFGEPGRVSREPVENRHVPGQIDTLVTLGYGDLEVQFYAVTGGRDLLAHAELRAPLGLSTLPFEVGASVEDVTAVLGEPARRSAGDLAYEDPDAYAFLTVSVADGVVRRIRLETPPD